MTQGSERGWELVNEGERGNREREMETRDRNRWKEERDRDLETKIQNRQGQEAKKHKRQSE